MASSGNQRNPWVITLLVAIIGAAGVVGAAVLPKIINPPEADGTTTTSVAPQAERVGLLHLEGEGAAERSAGLQLGSEGGVGYLSYITDGTSAVYDSRALGSGQVRSITARVASDSSGGDITIRLDGSNGTVLGRCPVDDTGGWLDWDTVVCDVLETVVDGPDTLHLEFGRDSSDSNPYLFNLDWLEVR